jgi:hypothetical protein
MLWLKRYKAAKVQMEKLREREAKTSRLAARHQWAATRRLFNE